VLRHYRIRSYEQGLKKVFEERLPRYSPSELERGWHRHYSNFTKAKESFVIDSSKLTKYDEDGKWNLDANFGAWPPNKLLPEVVVLRRKLDEKGAQIKRLQGEAMAKDERIAVLEQERNQLLNLLKKAQLERR
jgi:hypothetical protein